MPLSDQRTILIVSERHPETDLNTAFLRHANHRLLTSGPDDGVLTLVRDERPDLIVEELHELQHEGLELCNRLKADRETRVIPLILVTTPDFVELAREAAVDTLLCKPLAPKDFFDAVGQYVPLPECRPLRYTINLRFTFALEGRTVQAFSRDISMTGTFLKTDRMLPQGTHLDLTLHLPGPDGEIHCGGVVRRASMDEAHHRNISGIGIEFERIGDEDLARLERFLRGSVARRPSFFGG